MTKIKTHILSFCILWPVSLMLMSNNGNAQKDFDTASSTESLDGENVRQHNAEFRNAFKFTDTVAWRNFSPGYIDSLKNSKGFEYVKTGILQPEKKQKQHSAGTFSKSNLIFYFAIFTFVAFLAWYLLNNNIIIFRRRSASVNDKVRKDCGHEDIFTIQYTQAIQKALADKNYRLAIRLHYLQLLKTLTDRKIISYRPDKTNFDYLIQTRTTDYYNDFLTVTRNYEYSWYGLFNVSEQQYKKMEKGFEDLLKRL